MNDLTKLGRAPRNCHGHTFGRYDPLNLGVGISEALTLLANDHWNLYEKIFRLIQTYDHWMEASSFYKCEQAIVLFCHRSFGEELFPHVHAQRHLHEEAPGTASIFLNLTQTSNEKPVLALYPKLDRESKFYRKGYTDHRLMALYQRQHQPTPVEVDDGDLIVFEGDRIPHTFSYTDDLWMVLSYDGVNANSRVQYEDLFNRYGHSA